MSPSTQDTYSVTETLSYGGRANLYRGVRNGDGHPVILKVLDPRRSSSDDLRGLEHEYELGTLVESPAIVRPLALRRHDGMPALIMEDFGGTSLEHLLGAPIPVERFLRLASRIAGAVAELHRQNVIHRDLKPANILVGPMDDVKVADLRLASRLPQGRSIVQSPSRIEGSLPYLSPEQTGRMNRSVDGRADLYALGVIFYQMLTGQLPFQASDPLEWVHCHVAYRPRPPREIVSEIPAVLSNIVLKLLAKLAEDRYQTARGLQHDLDTCLTAWREAEAIAPFPLGEHDRSDRFEICEKLYGREEELATLIGAFQRVARSGTPELVLVAGYSGIGKSSLVREIHRPIARARGLFISGKFDQYKRDLPYATFAQAFAELVEQILTESEDRVARWKAALQNALGASGQLIIDIVPRLEHIIGPQPAVVSLPPLEAQNRFHLVFRQFVGVFARKEHPLVLFIDDFQWLDSMGLRLVEDILRPLPNAGHILVLGAYRSNEVGTSHPLMLTLDKMHEASVPVHEIAVRPLHVEHLCDLVADTLHCSLETAAPLAALVHDKSAGNPFFSIQFLTTLYQEGLLAFDRAASEWHWDIARIHARGFTDNVIDLLTRKLSRLPAPTRSVLKFASCVGSSADLHTLAVISNQAEEATALALQDAVTEGLALQFGDEYSFVHDRVQQATYALIEESDRQAVHLQIGRLLLRSLDPQRVEDRIFDVVSQLNRGVDLMTDTAEKDELARLDLLAARKAKSSIAYASARNLFGTAATLLPEDAWESRYELAYSIFVGRAECEYLCGAFAEAETLFDVVLARARSDLDKARVYELHLKLCQLAGKYDEAVVLGASAVRLFGVSFPDDEEALRRAIDAEVALVRMRLTDRRIADLANVPEATDSNARALIGLLVNMTAPAYIAAPELMPLVILKVVNCSLEFGPTFESCLGYSGYAVLLASHFDNPGSAYEFSTMALALSQKLGDIRRRGACLHIHGNQINFWFHPFTTDFPILEQGFLACLEAGDLVFAGFLAPQHVWQAVERGDPIDSILPLVQRYATFARDSRNDAILEVLRVEQCFLACLQGRTHGRASFDDESFDEERALATIVGANLRTATFLYHSMKLIAAYLAEDEPLAVHHADEARRLLPAAMSTPFETTFRYVDALLLARLYPSKDDEGRQASLDALADHEKNLARWASNCPENFSTKHALVSAEIARITGDELKAERRYEEAIRAAATNGFIHWQALANELAARFNEERGFETVANAYRRDALHYYMRWGAEAKVRALEAEHPQLRGATSDSAGTSFVGRAEHLDLLSVIKASQTISGVMVEEQLLETLLDLVLEEGGARRAHLLLSRNGSLKIAAEASVDTRRADDARPKEDEGKLASRLPLSVIQYVQRTKERLVLDDAAITSRFARDPYFVRVRPQSVLCTPIRRQTEMVGLLYLENELVPGAFTPERLMALELLAAQAAISLENARLLHETREALRLREEFLSLASHELRTPLTSLRMMTEALIHAKATGTVLPSETQDRSYVRILRAVERLQQLAGELLDATLIEGGELAMRPASMDLRAAVHDVVGRLEPDLRAARCTVSIVGATMLVGMWDRSRLEQVVTSLLSNAIKFGAGQPIEIRLHEADGVAHLVVEDHGSGIDESRLARIFERFERGVTWKHHGGLGLGLYIARWIVRVHGGTIRVESTPGVGSRFIVELPWATQPAVSGTVSGSPP